MPASPLPRWINLVVLAGALSSPPVRAQATWNVTLSRDTAGKLVRQGLNRATTFVTTPSVTIVVSCQSVDCRDVRGRVDIQGQGVARDSLPISAASATLVSLTLLRSDAVPVPAPRHLVLFVGGDEADPFLLTAGPTQDPPQVARTLSLTELLSAQCQVRTAGTAYDGTANRADFAVTPLGEVLSRPGDVIDEDDVIAVTVVGAEQLLPRLSVRRSSEFRMATSVRIAGAEVRVAELPGLRRQAAGQPPPCGDRTVLLHDFAPGRGEFEIALRTSEDTEVLGKVELGIHPLFTGAFSFGIVRSALRDPRFGLVHDGADSIITEVEDPTRNPSAPADESGTLARQRILYGVFYTPFFGRRDIEKEPILVRPTIGFALNDVSENVFLGGTITFQGTFSFLGGLHWGRVTTLDPQSGLDVGSVFGGSSEEIPTVKRWRGDLFLGVSLDLRAAAQFLKVAFGASG